MREGVLAAVDLSPSTTAVVETAALLAERFGWPLTLVHVIADAYLSEAPRRLAEVWQEAVGERIRQVQEDLEALAREALAFYGPPAARRVVHHGHPVREIAGEALRHRLAVLAAEGATPLERVARGGVSNYLLHMGEAPVLLISPGAPLRRLEKIAVGVDDSSAGLSAWRYGERLAARANASAVAIHLVSLAPDSCCVPTYLPPELLGEQDVLAHAQRALASRLGLVPERLVVGRGDEVDGLLDLARAQGADLLVVGSRAKSSQRTRIGRLVVGLVHRADLPLLVVPEAVPF